MIQEVLNVRKEMCCPRGRARLPTEPPDECVLRPLGLAATETSPKTMSAIHCHEYGGVTEISLRVPDDITAQRLHFSSQAAAVRS